MTIAAVLAVLASTHDAGGDGHGAPRAVGDVAGAGIDDVVQVASGAPPPASS